jgi:hypothetical protein
VRRGGGCWCLVTHLHVKPPPPHGSVMESRAQRCSGYQDRDSIKEIVEDGVESKTVLFKTFVGKALYQVCQLRENIGGRRHTVELLGLAYAEHDHYQDVMSPG